jgi:glycosyltransferase involved in cell wall biosynthesis
MTVVVLDPALHSMGGHHHSAYLRLGQELRARSVRYRYLTSGRADRHLRLDRQVRPTFSRCVYGRTSWTHAQFLDDVETTIGELKKGLSWGAQSAEVFIVPCADQVLTLALARHIANLDRRWAPQVLMWLLYGPHCKRSLHDPETGRVAYEYEGALSALAQAVRRPTDLSLVCETQPMASYYSAMTGLKVGVFSGPGLRLEIPSQPPPAGVPTILCVGHANAAKGYGLLSRAISSVLARGLEVRFLVHGSTHDSDDRDAISTMEDLQRLASVTPGLTVSTEVLSPACYEGWIAQADLVLMPYDPAIYGPSRGSGVLSDAERTGVPGIAPRHCGFATDGIAAGRIAAIESYDSNGIADAIVDAVSRLPLMKSRARMFALQMNDHLGERLDFHLARVAHAQQKPTDIMRLATAILSRR